MEKNLVVISTSDSLPSGFLKAMEITCDQCNSLSWARCKCTHLCIPVLWSLEQFCGWCSLGRSCHSHPCKGPESFQQFWGLCLFATLQLSVQWQCRWWLSLSSISDLSSVHIPFLCCVVPEIYKRILSPPSITAWPTAASIRIWIPAHCSLRSIPSSTSYTKVQ
jgi:hypothetical protein